MFTSVGYLRIVLTLSAGLICCSAPAIAQLSSASLTGVIRDASDSVVPDAAVILHNVATGVEHTGSANSAGNYVFVNIQPGRYTVSASKTGFSTSRVAEFTLAVNQTATFDIVLQVGSVAQNVTVEASGELIQASTAELGGVVAQKQVVDLPLNGRNFTQLLSLTPGVVPVSVGQNSGGAQTAITRGSTFSFPAINGQTNRSNYFMIDGINNQGTYNGTYAIPPIIDSVEEFKVNSHNDQAEFGSALGGIINVVSKSGTNALHGSAWEYLRNDAFDARSTFLSAVTPYRQNEFGVSGGGPVMIPRIYDGRNKTFFFAAYEGFRYRQPNASFYRVPTDAELAGDLSDIPTPIFNPFSTRPNPAQAGGFIRDAFPSNQIPGSLLSSPMVAYAKATLPKPVNVGLANVNAIDNTPVTQNQDQFSVRIDQVIGRKDSVWFRYSGLYQTLAQSGGRPQISSLGGVPAQNYGANWVHTFSPSLILQVQYGRAHVESDSVQRFNNLPANFVQTLGFAPSFAMGFMDGKDYLPSLVVTGYFSGGEALKNFPDATSIHQWKADVTKITGSHTLAFGGELDQSNSDQLVLNPNVTFNPQQTANPANSAQLGNALASFLLNVPDSAKYLNLNEPFRWGGVMSLYFQDSWKALPRLTINLGLRYDRTFIPPYGTDDTIGQLGGIETGDINFNDGTWVIQKLPPSCAVRGHAPCIPTADGKLPDHVVVDPRGKILHDTTKNFGPRVGLAYRFRPDTVIRSSFGISYDNWGGVTQNAANYSGSWPDVGTLGASGLNVPVAAQLTPNITALNPFPGGAVPAATPFNQVSYYPDPYGRNPYSMQWNFGVQHEFSRTTVLSVNYVGSGSRRTDLGGVYNTALTPGPGTPQLRAPFPYIKATNYNRSWGRANYNALQVLFQRKYQAGFAYQLAYTYSKSIDVGSSGWFGVEGFSVQDPYHFNNDRSVSAFDLPHVFSLNFVYEFPFGRGKRFSTGSRPVDYVISNWQVNAISTARSGQPYGILITGDIANTGNANYERPNLVGDPNLPTPTRQQWFNRLAFVVPAAYTFGNLGRNVLRTDGLLNVDCSIFRQFPIMEGRRIEFRAEAFNLTNSVVYGTPSNNMTSSTFGQVLSLANSPRKLQLGLKVIF